MACGVADVANCASRPRTEVRGLANCILELHTIQDHAAAPPAVVVLEGRGNIVTTIEKLKKMGAKVKKSLPEPILKRAHEDDFEELNEKFLINDPDI